MTTTLTDFLVQNMINRLAGDCSTARSRISVASAMRNVKYASDVQANAMIRALPQARQDLRRVHDCAENRLEELLNQQLQKLAACTTGEEIRTEHARLIRNDWCFLRGSFGRIFIRADREYQRILHLAERRSSTMADSEDEHECEPPPDDEDVAAPAP